MSSGQRKAAAGYVPAILLLLTCMSAQPAHGAERDGRWAILIAGVSGDPDLLNAYGQELKDLRFQLEGPLGFPRDQIMVLAEDPSRDPGAIQRKSTRDNLAAVCRELSGRVRPEDFVFVFIEGHGDYDGRNYKLNLVGPDPTADELASMLYSITAKQFVIVNATNCSGGSLPALSRPGKIVITSTKSGMEKNQTHFGEYFVQAFKGNAGDADKNGRVSMIEAFLFAARRVEEYYQREDRLQTEHPVLDDNGDGQAQNRPSPENGDGLLAQTTYLDRDVTAGLRAKLTPEQQILAREAAELEKQIDTLKYAKRGMPEAEYEDKLESLLLRLAEINAKLPK